ncbi:hypothetical protein AAIR98_001064 [Elusimicrobium simillimum]|uniref:hypothetical protein n=1 Tax=Elusimicrobium simillimum TaxID=3143438 RepID=UPI003C6F5CB3
MAFIVKKGTSLKNMDKKTAYTWGACALLFIFVISTLASVMGGEEGNPDQFDGLKSRAVDLAQLPFVNDEAEQELLARYNDINGNPVTSTLYSAEEKEARQEMDALVGIPDAPDEEYEDAQKEIDARNARNAAAASYSTNRGSYTRTTTPIGSLSSAGMARMSGGGGSRTWTPGNAVPKAAGTGGKGLTKESVEKLKKTEAGRNLLNAYAQTMSASNKSGEAAMSDAIAAFKNSKSTAELDSDLEKALESLTLEDMVAKAEEKMGSEDPGATNDEEDNLKDAESKTKDNNKEAKDCDGFWECLGQQALKGLVDKATNIGADYAKGKLMDNYKNCMKDAKNPGNCEQLYGNAAGVITDVVTGSGDKAVKIDTSSVTLPDAYKPKAPTADDMIESIKKGSNRNK